VKNWFRKFIRHFRELRLSPDLPPPSLRALVWTLEEAEAAWKAKRTEVNLAIMLPQNVKSVQSATGDFMVDGRPARVQVCINESVKQWILMPPDKRLEQKREKERLEREQDRLERQTWAKSPPDPEPIEGRTCGACGGKLVLVILNYYCDPGDIITPADTAEKCLSCGRSTVLIHRRGRAEPQKPETNNDDRRQ
jgi:hypothetical protein